MRSLPSENIVADQNTTEGKERLTDVRSILNTSTQPFAFLKPQENTFNATRPHSHLFLR